MATATSRNGSVRPRLARIVEPDTYHAMCRVPVPPGAPVNMTAADIANVECITQDELFEAVEMPRQAAEQTRIDDAWDERVELTPFFAASPK